jgi:uncharacterized protein
MKTNSEFMEQYTLPAFLILSPLISLTIPAFLSPPAEVTPLILIFVPALLAILFTAFAEGGKGVGMLLKKLFQWQIGFRWYFSAIVLAVGLRLVMSLLALILGLIPSIQLSPWSAPQFIIIGVFTFLGAVMEGLGWQGYALPRLLVNRSALLSSLIIGIPWGLVHLGLILPGQMNAGTSWAGTILFLIGLSVVLTWFFIHTRGSLVAVILYHAAQNFFVFLNGGIEIAPSMWLLTVVTLALALILIFSFGPGLQHTPVKEKVMVNTDLVESK